jgi:hypothetical protein
VLLFFAPPRLAVLRLAVERFFAPARFAVLLFFAAPRFAVLRFAVLRLAVLRLAVLRRAVLRLAELRVAVFFLVLRDFELLLAINCLLVGVVDLRRFARTPSAVRKGYCPHRSFLHADEASFVCRRSFTPVLLFDSYDDFALHA